MAKSSGECEIREGFICPICLCDLKAVDQLQDHFELTHSSEDHDVFQALKGFIGNQHLYLFNEFMVEKV